MSRDAIWIGLTLGVALAVIERFAPRSRSVLPSATAVGIGLMMPASIPVSFCVGAVSAAIAQRLKRDAAGRFVIPIASGVIAGESILAVVVAAWNNLVFR